MDEQRNGAHQELVSVIRQVRSRWRLKLLLRGGVIVLLGALAAIALASLGLQSYKFSPASVTTLRFAVFGAFALLLGLWLVLPMRRRVTDMQVALYVEEHEKSLQAAILSAVDVSRPVAEGETPVPPAIVEKMVAQAIEKCRAIEGGKAIGRNTLRRLAVGLTSAAGVMALLFSIGPEFLRQGASALLVLSKSAEAASPYAINVQPGDATVPKGSDQMIKARLAGFRTNEVTLMIKEGGGDKIDRRPLVVTGEAGVYEGMIFDLKSSIEYYVEADGVKSPTYKMTVVELPAVANLELEYIYPAYTGLPPQKVEIGGDVAALRGTEVRVKVTSTMTTPGGKLILDPGNPSELAVQGDGKLTGSFTIGQDGYYHVELAGPRGEKVTASPKYTIDAIEDQPPTVSIEKPRRDIQANPVEEVLIKARADDDYGVKQLDLVYTVNGGPEKTVTLYGKGAKPLAEVSASHTIYLEELQVKPGDFVAYYAVARDSDTVKGPKATSSDIYFVQIRPFGQNFREAQSQEGGGGGGGGSRNNQPGALSEQQRQVISATFNVDRDRPKNPADKVKEDTKFVELAQERLRTEVESLVQTMRQRLGGGGGENIQRIVDLLPKATAEMKNAEELLKSQKTKDALVPEQKALKHLQDAEQVYELEVRRQQQGQGGGGGGGQMASELADLFQLQLDRQANQYETQQRAQQQSADQQIDELAEKLRELARRQLQQAEQQRRLRGQQQGQGGGSGQRALADEVEQAARQLEQLRREAERQGQQRQDLADAAKRLQESANAMRQAAANGQDGGAQAQQAYQRLQEASKLLQNNQAQQSGQSVRDLQRQADDLARQQKDVSQRVAGLDKAGDQRDQQARQLSQEKNEMRGKVGDIEQQLGNLSRQALAANQRDAARKLQEAAATIRDNMLQQKIEYSRSAMAGGSEYTKPIEQDIAGNIDQLRQKLGEAAKAADAAQQGQGLTRAANNMRDLSRGLNSLGEQLDQTLGQQGQGQQGQQGQGQQGDKGQGDKGQGEKGSKGQGQQGEKGQGQGEKGQGQGQGQGEKGQGQGEKGQGQGQGQGEKGQGQGEGKGGGKGDGKGEGSQRLGEGKGQGGKDALTGNPAPQGSAQAGGDARPELNQGQIRQWANQANTLANDAADVRRQLQAGGIPVKDLAPIDDVVKALRALGDPKAYGDPGRLQQLYGTAVDKFKALEYEVRKKVDTTNDQLFLSGSDEVPPKYKDLIQEYYRKLSKKGGGK